MTSTDNSRHLNRLLDNGVVEVRCLDKKSAIAIKQGKTVIWTAVYDNYHALSQGIGFAESRDFDIYTTINPLKVTATNDKLRPFKRTTRDSDVSSIRSVFFDFDPERQTGTAATENQISKSMDVACEFSEYLDDHGWLNATIGFSGNGAHLVYAVEMTKEEGKCLPGLYAALEKRFTTDEIKFDVMVKNPSRISRCYGTTNQKSGRLSECLYSDQVTPAKSILDLANKITPPKKKPKHWVKKESEEVAGRFVKNWDIVSAFKSAGLYLDETAESGKHFVTCINAGSHSETSPTETVIYEGEWPQYHCSHDHCSGLNIADAISQLRV